MDEDFSLEHYIEIGAVDVSGIDEDGELIFNINPIAKDIAPELWVVHKEHVDEVLLELFEKGLVSVDYNENLEASFEITEAGKEIARQHGLIPFED
jgi:hypothetical protein